MQRHSMSRPRRAGAAIGAGANLERLLSRQMGGRRAHRRDHRIQGRHLARSKGEPDDRRCSDDRALSTRHLRPARDRRDRRRSEGLSRPSGVGKLVTYTSRRSPPSFDVYASQRASADSVPQTSCSRAERRVPRLTGMRRCRNRPSSPSRPTTGRLALLCAPPAREVRLARRRRRTSARSCRRWSAWKSTACGVHRGTTLQSPRVQDPTSVG